MLCQNLQVRGHFSVIFRCFFNLFSRDESIFKQSENFAQVVFLDISKKKIILSWKIKRGRKNKHLSIYIYK